MPLLVTICEYFTHFDPSLCAALKDGRSMIAMGRKDGVEIGILQQANSRRLVLHIQNVTHAAFIPDSGAFLVLANNELWAYDIESMVPTSLEKQRAARARERLSTLNVLWFRVGRYDGRTLVVFVTKELDGCVFHVFEVLPDPSVRAGLRDFTQKITNNLVTFFKPFTQFKLPGEAQDTIFLERNVLFILGDCGGGFRKIMIAATEGLTQNLPFPVFDTDNEDNDGPLAKRVATGKPLNVFRVPRAGSGVGKVEFLLCYDEFGVYVDINGELSRQKDASIQWSGSVQCLVSNGDHFLLFSSRAIEVQALDTGRVVKTVPTQDIDGVWAPADWGYETGVALGAESDALSPKLLAYCSMRESGDLYGLQTKRDL